MSYSLQNAQNTLAIPYGILVKRGNFPAVSGLNKFGYNSQVGTNGYETVWDGNNVYTYIETAGTATVTSSSTDDNNGTVEVFGLDANYAEVSETLTIGGSAGSVEFFRVHRAILKTANTGSSNVGTVTVTVDTKSAAIIKPTQGQTLMCVYTIPANKRAYLVSMDIGSSKDLEHEIKFMTRPSGGAFNAKAFITTRGGYIRKSFDMPVVIGEKTDVEIMTKGSATSAVSAGFELVIEDDR